MAMQKRVWGSSTFQMWEFRERMVTHKMGKGLHPLEVFLYEVFLIFLILKR